MKEFCIYALAIYFVAQMAVSFYRAFLTENWNKKHVFRFAFSILLTFGYVVALNGWATP